MRKTLRYAGYATFWSLVVAIFIFESSQKLLISLAFFTFLVCCAYSLSVDSPKSRGELLKNAIIISVVLAAVSFFWLGQPSLDEDGMVIDEGFEPTYGMRAIAAVETFARVLASAVAGIWIATFVRSRETPVAQS